VHRGHQALLARAREIASSRQLPLCVLTFEPYAAECLRPHTAPPRIALLRDKCAALQTCGVDHIILAHFNPHFAGQSHHDFVSRIIMAKLAAQCVVVGDDFRYGYRRAGNFSTLQAAGRHYGFDAIQIHTLASQDGVRISSSAVRAALASGNLDATRTLLGRPYTLSGHVIHGHRQGHALGFPTLNIRIVPGRLAPAGIFTVRVHGLTQAALPGVASLGVRPTIDDSGKWFLETHVLDWDDLAYGQCVRIELLQKLRDEARYPDLATLTAAIAADIAQARLFFNLSAS